VILRQNACKRVYLHLSSFGHNSTFAWAMTLAEAKPMQPHGMYCAGLLRKGIAVVLCVVGDRKVPDGVGIVEPTDEAGPCALTVDDPVIEAGTGLKFDVYPTPRAAVRRRIDQQGDL
jgi:hypothetical protein